MANQHSYSFFGQKSAFFFQSPSKFEKYIYFRFIKKKNDGSWEKPSKKEGLVVKLSLEEQVMILEVLKKNILLWTGFHTYKDTKTPISIKWENAKKNRLWLNFGSYAKMLQTPEIEILKMLMTHILEEKIEHATSLISGKKPREKTANKKSNHAAIKHDASFQPKEMRENPSHQKLPVLIKEEPNSEEYTTLRARIKGETEKALLLLTEENMERWIPKSAIKYPLDSQKKDIPQSFLVRNWVLRKYKILS